MAVACRLHTSELLSHEVQESMGIALVCGVAERVHLVQQGYCADSVTRLFSESFRLIL